MKITKLGHCCLIMEENRVRVLTDPGAWTTAQNEVKNIDVVLITHEHTDHLHIDSLKVVLKNNLTARVITNAAVGKILTSEGIKFELVEDSQSADISGLSVEGFGKMHAEIYGELGMVQNVGYLLNNTLFYPGDALTLPGKPVDILALPVAGPWVKTKEVIEYAKQVKPRVCFPVHDGMLKIAMPYYWSPETALKSEGIDFKVLELDEETQL